MSVTYQDLVDPYVAVSMVGLFVLYQKTGKLTVTIAVTIAIVLYGLFRLYMNKQSYRTIEDDIDRKRAYIDPLDQYQYLVLSPRFIHFVYANRDLLDEYNEKARDLMLQTMNDLLQIKYRLMNATVQTKNKDINYVRNTLYPSILNIFQSVEHSLPADYPQITEKFEQSMDILHRLLRREMDDLNDLYDHGTLLTVKEDDKRARPSDTRTDPLYDRYH